MIDSFNQVFHKFKSTILYLIIYLIIQFIFTQKITIFKIFFLPFTTIKGNLVNVLSNIK